jgi:predicted Rossmann fold nucleotide-binding protein DprA/Smf involved in DNA uptake
MTPIEPAARLVRPGEPGYPPGLEDLPDPAPLHVVGTLPAWGTALVGTRAPSGDGLAMARELAALLDAPIVAGLSPGIDLAAHLGALAAGVATIAYLGSGLGAIAPGEPRSTADAIALVAGGLASEYEPDEPATRYRLMRRDRLQAAHARAVVLVETEATGGAMHTLRYAALLDRPRFAFAPRGDMVTSGNARAIANGARPLPWNAADAARIIFVVVGASAAPYSRRR